MGYSGNFSGRDPEVEPCEDTFYWTVYPGVKAYAAATGGKSFKVAIDSGSPVNVKTDAGDKCFTLTFDGEGQHEISVSHEESGLTSAPVKGQVKKGRISSRVELSKPWELSVVVKKKLPENEPTAFADVKIKVGDDEKTVDGSGQKGDLTGLPLDELKPIQVLIDGLQAASCKATVETVPLSTEDGLLPAAEPSTEKQDDKNPVRVRVAQPGAKVTVTIVVSLSVVKPKLEADPIALVHQAGENGDFVTSLSELTVQLDTKHPKEDLADLKLALKFDDKIACYTDDKGTKVYSSDKAVEHAKLAKLYVKGQKPGECSLEAKLSTDRTKPERSWRIEPDEVDGDKAEGKIWVEKLELEVYEFLEGKSDKNESYGSAKVTSTPKKRELHNQDADGTFTVAKLTVKKPSDKLWTKGAEAITLSARGDAKVYKEAKCQTELQSLASGELSKAPVDVWVKSTGATALDSEPAGRIKNWSAWTELTPEKDVTRCHVSLGAKTSAKDLVHGDYAGLDTFSFDVHLDRRTRNECGKRVKPNPDKDKLSNKDVAVACAGGHHYYDLLSKYHVNKNYGGKGNLFTRFIDALHGTDDADDPSRNNQEWAQNGLIFITKHLGNKKITLHDTMKGMLKDYLKRVLENGVDKAGKFGFDRSRGVPGVHAEVLAVNEILNAGLEPEEITVATYKLQKSARQGKRFVACTNCNGILLGHATLKVRVITDP